MPVAIHTPTIDVPNMRAADASSLCTVRADADVARAFSDIRLRLQASLARKNMALLNRSSGARGGRRIRCPGPDYVQYTFEVFQIARCDRDDMSFGGQSVRS